MEINDVGSSGPHVDQSIIDEMIEISDEKQKKDLINKVNNLINEPCYCEPCTSCKFREMISKI